MPAIKNKTITVKGIRSHCITGIKRTVSVTMNKRHYEDSPKKFWYSIIEGGVTGFEGLRCKHLEAQLKYGWNACVGTKGVWDSLFIPAVEMQKVVDLLQ